MANNEQVESSVDLKSVKKFVDDATARISTLKSHSNEVSNSKALSEMDLVKLDSSLKKNTAFIKKFRNLNDTNKTSLLKEINSINLTKFLSEFCNALVEIKPKTSDLLFIIELCVKLRIRYADFGVTLLERYRAHLMAMNNFTARYKNDVRLFAELCIANVLPHPESHRSLSQVLVNLTTISPDFRSLDDRSFKVNIFEKQATKSTENPPIINLVDQISVLIYFLKYCGVDWAGIIPKKIRDVAVANDVALPESDFLEPARKVKIQERVEDFYSSLCNIVQITHYQVANKFSQNKQALETKGEISEKNQCHLERGAENFNKLYAVIAVLGDCISREPPALKAMVEASSGKSSEAIDKNALKMEGMVTIEGPDSLFEDECTRSFYNDIRDIRPLLPAIALKSDLINENDKSSESSPSPPGSLKNDDAEDAASDLLWMKTELEDLEKSVGKTDDKDFKEFGDFGAQDTQDLDVDIGNGKHDTAGPLASDTDAFQLYLAELVKCINRDLIDELAVRFCIEYNKPKKRAQLVEVLVNCPKRNPEMSMFLGRYLATISPMVPKVKKQVCDAVIKAARAFAGKRDKAPTELKRRCMRYFGELVKFQLINLQTPMDFMKFCVHNFTPVHIDMLCALLESCGQFLYRSKLSHHRTRIILEVMNKKKKSHKIDSRREFLIDHVTNLCNPPQNGLIKSRKPVILPPHMEFMKQLLYHDLHRNSIDRCLKLFVRFPWQNSDVFEFGIRCLSSPWNFKYGVLRYAICMMRTLNDLHDIFIALSIAVVDSVLDNVKHMLELNLPKYNQRLISIMKYIAYFFEYRLIDAEVVFNLLYMLITFGVDPALGQGTTTAGGTEPYYLLDPPENLFRITLVCSLAETASLTFKKASHKRMYEVFFCYFQRYYWFKRSQPIFLQPAAAEDESTAVADALFCFPPVVELHYTEAVRLKLSPKKVANNYSEACDIVRQLEATYRNKLKRTYDNLFGDLTTPQTVGGNGDEMLEDETDSDTLNGDEAPSCLPDGSEDEEDVREDLNETINCGETSSKADGASGEYGMHQSRKQKPEVSLGDLEFERLYDQVTAEFSQERFQQSVLTGSVAGSVSGAVQNELRIPSSFREKTPSAVEKESGCVRFALLVRGTDSSNKSAGKCSGHSSSSTFNIGSAAAIPMIVLPKENVLTQSFMRNRAEQEREQRELKQIVLNMHDHQLARENEEDVAGFFTLHENHVEDNFKGSLRGGRSDAYRIYGKH